MDKPSHERHAVRKALKLLVTIPWLWVAVTAFPIPTPQQSKPKAKAATPKSPAPAFKSCFKIGDAITVTGTASNVNFGRAFDLYQPRAKGLCIHYPKPTDRMPLDGLWTMGNKLPQGIYLEVTGILADNWPIISPVGFKVISFRNVDSQIKAEMADWTRRCNQWQDEQIAIISKRLHGGKPIRETDALSRNCGIVGVDAQLPHDVIGPVRRKEPSN